MARVYCVLNQVIIRKNALERSPDRQNKDSEGALTRESSAWGHTDPSVSSFSSVDPQYKLCFYDTGSRCFLEMVVGTADLFLSSTGLGLHRDTRVMKRDN